MKSPGHEAYDATLKLSDWSKLLFAGPTISISKVLAVMPSLALLNIRKYKSFKIPKCFTSIWLEGKITFIQPPLCMTSHVKVMSHAYTIV